MDLISSSMEAGCVAHVWGCKWSSRWDVVRARFAVPLGSSRSELASFASLVLRAAPRRGASCAVSLSADISPASACEWVFFWPFVTAAWPLLLLIDRGVVDPAPSAARVIPVSSDRFCDPLVLGLLSMGPEVVPVGLL